MGLSRNPVGFRASWLPCSNRSVAEPKNRDVNERNAILSGSNLHLTYSYFKEIGLELTNREKTISKMTKIRSRNLVYLCWCLVWLGKWFLFQTFVELDSVKDKEYDAQQTRQLIDSLGSPNPSDITISIPEEVE